MDDDSLWMVLHIASGDKQFNAQYQLDLTPGADYIVILGPRFAGATTGGPWRRFRCPPFAADAVTPQAVRAMIEWCLDESLTRREVNWRSHSLGI